MRILLYESDAIYILQSVDILLDSEVIFPVGVEFHNEGYGVVRTGYYIRESNNTEVTESRLRLEHYIRKCNVQQSHYCATTCYVVANPLFHRS